MFDGFRPRAVVQERVAVTNNVPFFPLPPPELNAPTPRNATDTPIIAGIISCYAMYTNNSVTLHRLKTKANFSGLQNRLIMTNKAELLNVLERKILRRNFSPTQDEKWCMHIL
jgi:hypothetical protein